MPVTPGVPGANLPPGDDALIRRIQELERVVRELSAANPLATAGLVPSPNTLTVTGNLVVGGTLSLPAGIIGNDALANPVAATQFYQQSSGTSVAGSYVDVSTATITVPTGFSKAVITAFSYAHLAVSGASPTEIDARTVINGVAGPVGSAQSIVSTSALTQLVTGLTGGGTFTAKTQAAALGSGTYTTDNAIVHGTCIWLR